MTHSGCPNILIQLPTFFNPIPTTTKKSCLTLKTVHRNKAKGQRVSSPGWFKRVSSSSLATTILSLSLLSMTKIMAWQSLYNVESKEICYRFSKILNSKVSTGTQKPTSTIMYCFVLLYYLLVKVPTFALLIWHNWSFEKKECSCKLNAMCVPFRFLEHPTNTYHSAPWGRGFWHTP